MFLQLSAQQAQLSETLPLINKKLLRGLKKGFSVIRDYTVIQNTVRTGFRLKPQHIKRFTKRVAVPPGEHETVERDPLKRD